MHHRTNTQLNHFTTPKFYQSIIKLSIFLVMFSFCWPKNRSLVLFTFIWCVFFRFSLSAHHNNNSSEKLGVVLFFYLAWKITHFRRGLLNGSKIILLAEWYNWWRGTHSANIQCEQNSNPLKQKEFKRIMQRWRDIHRFTALRIYYIISWRLKFMAEVLISFNAIFNRGYCIRTQLKSTSPAHKTNTQNRWGKIAVDEKNKAKSNHIEM